LSTPRREARRGLPLAMPGNKNVHEHRRDAVSVCYEFYGYFKALHVNETKSYLRLSF
jgi:hypothetical protein